MASPAMYPPKRRSFAGPIILIIIGVIFLLRNFGVIFPLEAFAKWWPLLLIVLGLVRLVEYYMAKREGDDVPILGGGTVVLLVFVIIIGLSVTGFYKAKEHIPWGEVRDEIQMDDDLAGLFGTNYTYNDEMVQDLPANAALTIVSDRGSVAVNSWDENKIKVVFHKRVFSPSQDEAVNINNQTKPQITVSGQNVNLNANTQGAGPKGVVTDLEIYVPAKVAVEIAKGGRGDVNISSRTADVRVSSGRGDVVMDQITGNVTASMRRGSLRMSKVTGNIAVDGNVDDIEAMDVTGAVKISGDVFGEIKLSKVSKGVVFQSSRTDLEVAKLDGDLDIDRGSLRGTSIVGPTRLTVRAKDVELDAITGDLRVQNDVGDVSVNVANKPPMGNIDVTTNRGSVRLTLPSKPGFALEARTQRGEFNSDFPELTSTTGDNERTGSTVKGTVGKSTTKVVVNTDVGDIDVRKATM